MKTPLNSTELPSAAADYSVLESHLGHTFLQKDLLKQALTHKSYRHENPQCIDNERLEFLGDAVLDLAMAHVLMQDYPKATEGELSALRSSLVNEQCLAAQAKRVDLGQWLFIGRGEISSGGRSKSSLLADAYEAILGAVYLDRGFDYCVKLIKNLFAERLESERELLHRSSKSMLQEALQGRGQLRPRYVLLSEQGPEHHKIFCMGVFIEEELVAQAEGHTKREAEHRAAELALEKLELSGTRT